MYIHIQTHTELYTCLAPNTIYNYIIRPILRQRVIRNADRLTHKANLIKPCKTGKGGSNFQKPGTFGNLKVLPFQNHHFLLDQMVFGDFMAILAKETVIF